MTEFRLVDTAIHYKKFPNVAVGEFFVFKGTEDILRLKVTPKQYFCFNQNSIYEEGRNVNESDLVRSVKIHGLNSCGAIEYSLA